MQTFVWERYVPRRTIVSIGAESIVLIQISRWVGVFIVDMISDLAITAFAATIIWGTQSSIKKKLLWSLRFFIHLW